MPISHEWRPITDIEEPAEKLTDSELRSLARVWASQREEMAQRGVLEEFSRRLRREWSIETGIIENVYTLDRGVTKTLIERGIDAALIPHGASNKDSVAVARIIQDHYDALDGMFDFVGGQRELTPGYVKELHAALLRNQPTYSVVDQFGRVFERPLERGRYKSTANSPTRPDGTIHQYCPPEHVASEMDRLIEIHCEQVSREVPPEIRAAWLHHRFTQIHPFADGNGRVARALASLVFIKADWFPLIIKRDNWNRYIDALEAADKNDLRSLVRVFVEAQRDAVILASEIGFDVRPIETTDEAISAVRDRLIQEGRLPLREWHSAKETASKLFQFSCGRFNDIAAQLRREISAYSPGFTFSASAIPTVIPDPVRSEMLAIAGQIPDFRNFSEISTLALDSGKGEKLFLTLQALGPRYRGFVGVIAYLFRNDREPLLLPGGTFQINYEESLADAQARFAPWLEQVIVEGLNEWRKIL